MTRQIRISGKQLGELALPDACPRCCWLKLQMSHKLPFNIFPGIFSSLDSFTKRLVHGWFDERGCPPPWLAPLGDCRGYLEPPHFSKFNFVHPRYGILLTGAPDGVLVRPDRSLLIIDYKTAKFSAGQESLFPMYETQLNAYAAIASRCGLPPVAELALVYLEPVTNADELRLSCCRKRGFTLGFSAHILNVNLRPDLVDQLLARTRELADMPRPPAGAANCKDCGLLQQIASLEDVRDGRSA